MAYDGWNLVGGCRLHRAAFMDLLGGVMDFKIVDGFGDWVDLGTRECEGLGGDGAESTDGFKQVLPSDVNT